MAWTLKAVLKTLSHYKKKTTKVKIKNTKDSQAKKNKKKGKKQTVEGSCCNTSQRGRTYWILWVSRLHSAANNTVVHLIV